MGIQAVKGVEIGDGFALAGLRGSEAHDEIHRDERGLYRETNHAGGIEGGISNGEEIVVRAAMKPLPTLMRPLRSVDLATGEPAEALVERSDIAAVEALAVVAEARSRSSSRGPRARSSAATRSATSSPRAGPTSSGSSGNPARPPRRPRRLHGRGQVDARPRRPPSASGRSSSTSTSRSRRLRGDDRRALRERGRAEFRSSGEQAAAARGAAARRHRARRRRGTSPEDPRGAPRARDDRLVDVSSTRPGNESRGGDGPWPRTRAVPRALRGRLPLYGEAADFVARRRSTTSSSPPPASTSRSARSNSSASSSPATARSRWSPTRTSPASTAWTRSSRSAVGSPDHELPLGRRRRARRPRAALAVAPSRPRRNVVALGGGTTTDPPGSRPPRTCEASTGWLSRRRWSARWTLRSAARRRSTCPRRRTSSARSTGLPGR